MDFPINIDTISMGLPILYFKGPEVEVLNYDVFLSLKVVFILANSADPEEMQVYAEVFLSSDKLWVVSPILCFIIVC